MRALVLLLAAAALAGCPPCEEACRVQSRALDRCLSAWDMEWVDLGAVDRPDWRIACVADANRRFDTMAAELQPEENAICQDLSDALRGEQDCDRVWAALIAE
jgi:hypothetical protein